MIQIQTLCIGKWWTTFNFIYIVYYHQKVYRSTLAWLPIKRIVINVGFVRTNPVNVRIDSVCAIGLSEWPFTLALRNNIPRSDIT
ncbi:hypothetical protein DERF_006336 [Dermatophagoides farinae]|uniref:Uncharacterized protein n=1 Tax=Dermatophagoides farinae TaxID=6954 RepID=A0A922L720_DERFA|nr:hypothetical protein DERF_006336 [Dermatophagoides farinae]